MEIDRIQQVQDMRVERTGSESERRRHQRPDAESDELPEQAQQDSQRREQQAGGGSGQLEGDRYDTRTADMEQQVAALHIGDTISITCLMPAVPASYMDTVSLSNTNAAGSAAPPAHNRPPQPDAKPQDRPPSPDTAESRESAPPASIDTIA